MTDAKFIKRRYVVGSESEYKDALRYAEPFDEAGLDVHIKFIDNEFRVLLYLEPGMPLVTVRGGIVQDIENIAPGTDIVVADYDTESDEPVFIGIFNFVDEAMRPSPLPF